MKRTAAAVIGALAALTFASPALATGVPVESACVTGFYVNDDEADRKPEPTEDGFAFEHTDLIHHATQVKLEHLEPGSYVAEPAPDQPSFFSVEVRNDNGAYGTLRWDPNAEKWSITIGAGNDATAGTFTDVNPYTLLDGKVTKWGAFDPDTATVVSFGVGYTANPPGTVETVVSSVTFNGETFDLTCKPEASPSASASPTASESASSSPAASSTTNPALPAAEPALPLTGAGVATLAGIGGALVLAGLALVFRRRRRFEA